MLGFTLLTLTHLPVNLVMFFIEDSGAEGSGFGSEAGSAPGSPAGSDVSHPGSPQDGPGTPHSGSSGPPGTPGSSVPGSPVPQTPRSGSSGSPHSGHSRSPSPAGGITFPLTSSHLNALFHLLVTSSGVHRFQIEVRKSITESCP